MIMDNFDSLIEQLSALNTAQIGELKSKLEVKWGVSATVFSVPAPTTVVEPVKAEPTEFAAHLTAFTNKMSVIKMMRELTGLGLIQAKEFVEKPLPQEIKTGLSKDSADEIKRKMEEAGASVIVSPA
jgi:large subunit ribosomal protein L7/L12